VAVGARGPEEEKLGERSEIVRRDVAMGQHQSLRESIREGLVRARQVRFLPLRIWREGIAAAEREGGPDLVRLEIAPCLDLWCEGSDRGGVAHPLQ
jgi:hypothetical protein